MLGTISRAIWDDVFPANDFHSAALPENLAARRVMDASLEIVARHRRNGTVCGADGKVRDEVLGELAAVGYWGLRVAPQFGGSGATYRELVPFLSRIATLDATIAGLASVHGCLGAVNSLAAFGDEEQQRRWLPQLASGKKLSAFALTEPNAGTDLTALTTTATRDGDSFVLHGEKRFITNAAPGRLVNLICMAEGQPQALLVELPENETPEFSFVDYDLHVQRRTHNRGLRFRGLRVPCGNLLTLGKGNGLTVAYHGLNRGRMMICATAAGSLRVMLANLLPWIRSRVTYGEPLANRELIQARVARLAALIVGCDALASWCATLLDAGERGELECIVAKAFAASALREAAIDIVMKTHGGRSFLRGHRFGDQIHEYLVPGIYEGESDVLGLAFFRTLAKQANERQVPSTAEARTFAEPTPTLSFAAAGLRAAGLEIRELVQQHGAAIANHQCRMAEIASRIQKLAALAVVASRGEQSHDAQPRDEVEHLAAEHLAEDLIRELTGARPSDKSFARGKKLSEILLASEHDWYRWIPLDVAEHSP